MSIQAQGRPRLGMMAGRAGVRPPGESRSTVNAFLEGLQDDLTFGLGDQARAVGEAISDRASGESLLDTYRRKIAHQHELDRIDAQAHATARSWGKGAGSVIQFATMGPLGRLARGGVRIAEATPLILREVGALGAVGAGGGAAGQAVSDRVTGHHSSIGDYVGAGIGGTVEALMSRSGLSGRAGAVGAAVTSAAQDILNRRRPSLTNMFSAAAKGGFLGAGVGLAGRKLFNALPSAMAQGLVSKEGLGELASLARTRARGDRTITRVKSREYLNDGKIYPNDGYFRKRRYTYPDQRTTRQLVESKAGWHAELSDSQKIAFKELGDRYRVDHLLPDDIGSMMALPAVQFGAHSESANTVAKRRR